jgi:hypothetical protein
MNYFFGFGEKKLSMGPFFTALHTTCLAAFFAGGNGDVDCALRFNGDCNDDFSFGADIEAFSPFSRVEKNVLTDAGGGIALIASCPRNLIEFISVVTWCH